MNYLGYLWEIVSEEGLASCELDKLKVLEETPVVNEKL